MMARFGEPLREAGHLTIEVDDFSALLEPLSVRSANVDLLLLDLRLSDIDGTEFLRLIRQHSPKLPVVVFSGSVTNANEVRSMSTFGIAGYVNEYCDTRDVLSALAPHLFPDSFNRRSSPRVVVAIPVSYRFDNAITAAVTLNISSGGLAIRTIEPLGVSAKVHTRFSLPGFSREIQADARVTWTDAHVGMGLQFEQMSALDQSTIDEYVEDHTEP